MGCGKLRRQELSTVTVLFNVSNCQQLILQMKPKTCEVCLMAPSSVLGSQITEESDDKKPAASPLKIVLLCY